MGYYSTIDMLLPSNTEDKKRNKEKTTSKKR